MDKAFLVLQKNSIEEKTLNIEAQKNELNVELVRLQGEHRLIEKLIKEVEYGQQEEKEMLDKE